MAHPLGGRQTGVWLTRRGSIHLETSTRTLDDVKLLENLLVEVGEAVQDELDSSWASAWIIKAGAVLAG